MVCYDNLVISLNIIIANFIHRAVLLKFYVFIRFVFLKFLGATANDEMCNLYLMYYSTIEEDINNVCAREERKDITNQLPFDSDKLLPEKRKRFNALDRKGRNMKAVRNNQLLT